MQTNLSTDKTQFREISSCKRERSSANIKMILSFPSILRRNLVALKYRHRMDKTKAIIATVVAIGFLLALFIIVKLRTEEPQVDVTNEDIVQKVNITGDVLELKSDTFEPVIKGNEYVLVEFCKFHTPSHHSTLNNELNPSNRFSHVWPLSQLCTGVRKGS